MRLDTSYVQGQCDFVLRTSSDVIKLNATLSYLKPDGDDVEIRERWTPTPGCRACESAHANKHLVRCQARRYEYRLKYGRNPPVTKRGVYHEPETVPDGTAHVESETIPVSDREREQDSSSQPPSEPAQTETTHTPVERLRLQGKQPQVQSEEGRQTQTQNRESSVTTHVPRQPMDLSDLSARVRFNMKQRPLESQGDRSKQRRVMEDPDEDEVMIGEVQVNEEVEHPTSPERTSITKRFHEFPWSSKFRGHEHRGHQNSLGAETARRRCHGKIREETVQHVEGRKQ